MGRNLRGTDYQRPERTAEEMAVERGTFIADRAVRAARAGDDQAVHRETEGRTVGELRLLVAILTFAYAAATPPAANVQSALVAAEEFDRRRTA